MNCSLGWLDGSPAPQSAVCTAGAAPQTAPQVAASAPQAETPVGVASVITPVVNNQAPAPQVQQNPYPNMGQVAGQNIGVNNNGFNFDN